MISSTELGVVRRQTVRDGEKLPDDPSGIYKLPRGERVMASQILTINHNDPSQPFLHSRSPRRDLWTKASGCVRNDLPQTVEYMVRHNLLSIQVQYTSRDIKTPAYFEHYYLRMDY